MKSGPRAAFSGGHVTLDAPDEYVVRIIFSEDLQMRVEAVIVQINVEAAAVTFRTNIYVSAVNSGSQGKNSVVRYQSLLLLESLTSHRDKAEGSLFTCGHHLQARSNWTIGTVSCNWEEHPVRPSLRGYPGRKTRVVVALTSLGKG